MLAPRINTICSTVALIIIANTALAADWNRFRGPDGNGITDEKLILADAPKKIWTSKIGEGSASLIIHGDKLFTIGKRPQTNKTSLICLDAGTGKEIWHRPLDSWSRDSSPTYHNGKLYVLRSKDKPLVQCHNASDGNVVWTTELTKPTGNRHYNHAGSPLIWNDMVIVNVGGGAALKIESGEKVWHHEGLGGLATPVPFESNGNTGVMVFGGDTLYARDIKTGELLWSIPWKTNLAVNACDPIYRDGKVFICTTYGKHAALFDITTKPAKKLWREDGSSFSSGLLKGKHLYCFTGHKLSCLDFETGKAAWRGPHTGGGGSAIAVDNQLIVLSDRGKLSIGPLSPIGFEAKLELQVHGGTTWTPPSYVNGLLFIRNKEGEAVCFRIARSN